MNLKLIFLAVAVVGLAVGVGFQGSQPMVSGISKAFAGVGFIGWFIIQVFAPLWDEKPIIPPAAGTPKNHH